MTLNRRAALGLAAGLALFSAKGRADVAPMAPFSSDAFRAALAAGKVVVVHVQTSWCPICRTQKPILEKLRAEPRFKDVLWFSIDFDADRASARELGAQHQSTLIVYKGGREARRSVGEAQAEWIAAMLDDVV